MKPWLQWTIGVGLVMVAWGIALVTPPEEAREAPFSVPVTVGEQATGRNIVTTVTSVVRADHVTAGDWSADGNWVVVNLTAAAVSEESGAGLRLATLTVGGRTYSASERPDSLYRQRLFVGIPRSGSLAFELPGDVLDQTGILTLGENSDPRLDSVLELPLELVALPHPPEAALQETGWTHR